MATLPNSETLPPNKCWIEGGILYAQFNRPSNLEEQLAFIDECMQQIDAHKLNIVPLIIIFAPEANLSIVSFTKVGKIINNELLKHISTMQLVDVQYAANPLFVVTLSKFFLRNNLQVCASLEEAEENARRHLADTTSILQARDA